MCCSVLIVGVPDGMTIFIHMFAAVWFSTLMARSLQLKKAGVLFVCVRICTYHII